MDAWSRLNPLQQLAIGLAAAIALLAALYAVVSALNPAPPRQIMLATGPEGGAYAAAGEALRARLEADGLTVTLVATEGSVENLSRLTTDDVGMRVDAALVQGGVGVSADMAGDVTVSGVEALGAVFYEPLWMFARRDVVLADLRDLAGLRVAAGGAGSGVRALLKTILNNNGLSETDITLAPIGGADAASAVLAGEVDVAVFVTGPDRAYVRRLALAEGVTFISLDRAEAYARRHGYLQAAVLPRGALDLSADKPGADVAMLVSAAALSIREDLHPALQAELLQAADDAFRARTLFSDAGAFPNPRLAAFPLTEEAKRYYDRGGPSFLRRYLPFWAANLVDRLWVLAIPALTLLYPLFKAAPPVYRWRIRRRIIRWYGDLRSMEQRGMAATTLAQKSRIRLELRRMLEETARIKVPLGYHDDVYRLRSHIRFVDGLVSEDPRVVEDVAV